MDASDWVYRHESLFVGLAVVAVLAAIIVGTLSISWFLNEKGCDVNGDKYGLETDYKFISNTCFATLDDGRNIDINAIRGVEEGRDE